MTKKKIILLVKILITIGILALIFYKIPISEVWAALKKAKILYFCLAYVILIGIRYIKAYRIKIFTDVHNMKISIQKFFEISLATSFYGLFLPGTLAGGAVRWYKISKEENRPAESLTAIMYDRLISSLGILMVGVIFWFFERNAQTNQGIGYVLFITLFVFIITYIFAFNGKVAEILIKLISKMAIIPKVVREKILKVLKSSYDYRQISERMHFEIFIVTILFDLFGILAMYLFCYSLDLQLTFIQIGWIRSVIIFLSMLPISFSGIGVREGSLIFLLGVYGIQPANALAFSFLILSGNIVLSICGGIVEIKNMYLMKNK